MATLTLEQPLPRGDELPYEDDQNLESDWHVAAMNLLIGVLQYHWRDRSDIYIAGNSFVYFDPAQAKNRNFRGPDVFVVKGVKSNHLRNSWVVWEEDGLRPNFVIELASESTAQFDKGDKRIIYQQELKTPEYIVYDPTDQQLQGWRLNREGRYRPIHADQRGWLWSEQLELWLGQGERRFPQLQTPVQVPRFFDRDGHCLPTEGEAAVQHAAAEAQRADTEKQARLALEAELARLKAEIVKKQD